MGQDKVFAHWSHATIFVTDAGDIVEALGGGVQQRNISVYHGTEYVVVHLPATTTPLDREQAVEFADFSLNDPYGWLTIVSVALCLLTGAKFSFGVDGSKYVLLWSLGASSDPRMQKARLSRYWLLPGAGKTVPEQAAPEPIRQPNPLKIGLLRGHARQTAMRK